MAFQPLSKDPNQTLGNAVGRTARNVFNRTLGRLFGAGLGRGAESVLGNQRATARWSNRNGQTDWRVKLTIPSESVQLQKLFFDLGNTTDSPINYNLMKPLADTGGLIFPITPSVIIQHQANYSQLATTHANYPYYAYQNSEPANLTVVAEFPVQNQHDAEYWVAAIHFLRSVTKMFFGGDEATKGNPPPILKFNGYGNHVFKNVPVIVTNFTCELRSDVDYISTTQNQTFDRSQRALQQEGVLRTFTADSHIPETWAPSLSTITVQIQPVYSRDSVKNFSMKKFVRGELYNQGGGNNSEGVGFI